MSQQADHNSLQVLVFCNPSPLALCAHLVHTMHNVLTTIVRSAMFCFLHSPLFCGPDRSSKTQMLQNDALCRLRHIGI
jgi:hypothetical protein